MRLKPDVLVAARRGGIVIVVHPAVWYALQVAEPIWIGHGAPDLVVTSLLDGNHRWASLHYSGCAFDVRTKAFPTDEAKLTAVADLKRALGPDFDVLLEHLGKVNEHCHGEFQPKGPVSDSTPTHHL
jgi:hypothetical protein